MQNFFRLVFGIGAAVTLIIIIALVLESYLASEEITIFVSKKEKITTSTGEEYWLIYTENEIFESRDNMFHRKDDTRKISKKLKKNNSYRVRVVGYEFGPKLPFFMDHRNITAVLESKKAENKY
jgi:hypothetical protein